MEEQDSFEEDDASSIDYRLQEVRYGSAFDEYYDAFVQV
jgi:hypothetical protein